MVQTKCYRIQASETQNTQTDRPTTTTRGASIGLIIGVHSSVDTLNSAYCAKCVPNDAYCVCVYKV